MVQDKSTDQASTKRSERGSRESQSLTCYLERALHKLKIEPRLEALPKGSYARSEDLSRANMSNT